MAEDPRLRLRRLGEEDWSDWRELRLSALREAPSAFGSTLADWSGEGDTEQRWRARLRTVPLHLIAALDSDPVGMVSGMGPDDGDVELLSMWVSPAGRGRGVGDALVGAVISWARRQGATRLVLDVRTGNEHAIGLYRRHGFEDIGPTPGLDPSAPPERRMVLRIAPPRA